MEIVSYPIGLLVGLFPVLVDLGPGGKPASLLLDRRPVCTVTARAPSCMVDLGLDPRIHLLEIERRDARGAVTDRVERWVNRPGVTAEVRAPGHCDETRRECELTVQWGHPYRLDPARVTVSLDGKAVYKGPPPREVRSPFPQGHPPQLVTAEAVFPDGRRASYSQLLYAPNAERAQASLAAVPVVLAPGTQAPSEAELADGLREAGWSVRAVERPEPEVVFVVEPRAFQRELALWRDALLRRAWYRVPLENANAVELVVADATLRRFDAFGSRSGRRGWLDVLLGQSALQEGRRLRTTDAVAAAGYVLGAAPRPRAVVLVLAGDDPDQSTFAAAQARRYLSEVLVPLTVWRLSDKTSSEWPEGRRLRNGADLDAALRLIRFDLDRQRVVWLEGSVDPFRFDPRLPRGLELAGRQETPLERSAAASTPNAAPAAGEPRPSRNVYALASDPKEPDRLYAGTDRGLFESRDGGGRWREIKISAFPIEVTALGFARNGGGFPIVGSNGALARRLADGRWAAFPALGVLDLAPDSFDPSTLYAATRRGVLRSEDGGLTWADASRGLEKKFVLGLAADPRHRNAIWAATAGDGVYRSANRGRSWKVSGVELQKTVVRRVLIDPFGAGVLYAATDGGVFVSRNDGGRWSAAGLGLPRAPFYALAADPRAPGTVYAGGEAGIFVSRDQGRTWSFLPGAPRTAVTALAFDARGRLHAGTLGRGILAVEGAGAARRE